MTRADAALSSFDNPTAHMSAKDVLRLGDQLQGRVLTVAEAVILDKQQLEATKTLLKREIWDTIKLVTEWMAKQEDGKGSNFPF